MAQAGKGAETGVERQQFDVHREGESGETGIRPTFRLMPERSAEEAKLCFEACRLIDEAKTMIRGQRIHVVQASLPLRTSTPSLRDY